MLLVAVCPQITSPPMGRVYSFRRVAIDEWGESRGVDYNNSSGVRYTISICFDGDALFSAMIINLQAPCDA